MSVTYGYEPADGSGVRFQVNRSAAEKMAALEGGEVVYRTHAHAPWQRAADMVVVDRADVATLLIALRAFHEDNPGMDEVMLAAQKGIVDRLARALGNGGSSA